MFFVEYRYTVLPLFSNRLIALISPRSELGTCTSEKWVHFFGPVSGKTKVDSFVGYAAFLGQARGGTPSGLNC